MSAFCWIQWFALVSFACWGFWYDSLCLRCHSLVFQAILRSHHQVWMGALHWNSPLLWWFHEFHQVAGYCVMSSFVLLKMLGNLQFALLRRLLGRFACFHVVWIRIQTSLWSYVKASSPLSLATTSLSDCPIFSSSSHLVLKSAWAGSTHHLLILLEFPYYCDQLQMPPSFSCPLETHLMDHLRDY